MKWAVCGISLALVACTSLAIVACGDEEAPAAPESLDDAGPAADVSVTEAAPPVVDAGLEAGPPLDVPESLVKALRVKPYVEESCQPTTYEGWPYAAQKCTYYKGLVVTVANPDPERVARWIVEASSLIPALAALHTRDRASWEAGLLRIAKHTLGQSSRIFPLQGQIDEGTVYTFERGVTKTCGKGCYCRINSTSRQQWCAYAANVLKTEVESTCLSKYGQTTNKLTEAWLARCLDNHVASWASDSNEHYRAQAWNANQAIAPKFPDPTTANAADVLTALGAQYPIY
jgi:hypothetical protein